MRDLVFCHSHLIFSKTNDCKCGEKGIRMEQQVSMTVLVIDDDAHIRTAIGKFLIARGHTVIEAANGERGVEVVESQAVDIVITDVKMPGMDGFEVLRRVRSVSPEAEVIVITGVKEAENAFRALREGAFDFFNKPFKVEELHAAIQRTVRYQVLRKEKNRVQDRLDQFVVQERERSDLNALIGESEAIAKMKAQIRQVAATDNTTVLIVGETGTGKELVARAVHCESDRAGGPFVAVNCSAIPGSLFESAFFGHKKGAFTDAKVDQKGHFELADGGTLFLDEIGDMPLEMQVRLLRTLENRFIRPVGSSREIAVDVRVVAATNRVLSVAVREGSFREDLYYRLNVFAIQAPPLRERTGDVLFLARHVFEPRSRTWRVWHRGLRLLRVCAPACVASGLQRLRWFLCRLAGNLRTQQRASRQSSECVILRCPHCLSIGMDANGSTLSMMACGLPVFCCKMRVSVMW